MWQAAWLVYILYHSIRYSNDLKSQNTPTFGKMFYISWILSCVFNALWITLFALEELIISALVLIAISISLYVNGYVNHKYIGLASTQDSNDDEFPSYITSKCSIILYRILVLNGIAFYGTWCSIAQCLNIAIMFTYSFDVYVYTSSLIALSVLTIVILAYWFLDFYYLRSWLAWTYSPYAVLLWALSAVSTNPKEGELALKGATRTWVNVLVVMVIVGTVCKFVSGFLYVCKQQSKINDKEVKSYTSAEVDVDVEV